MFLRFSQASPKTYAQYGGSGLGLFISRELTELQGGQIGVHSVAGQGSTFTFYIKTRRYVPTGSRTCSLSDPLSAVGTPSPAPRIGAAASTLAGDSADSSVFFHILLVEDNVINQRVLAQYLIREGCVVHVANHGAEALDFLARTAYFSPSSLGRQPESEAVPLDIILMDLEMPFMDGLTCVRRIREMQREGTINAHIPIIAITANARKEQISKALETGMVLCPYPLLDW
jgi:CheY-like chemotaxis protein